jgi:hypothetical protein
MSVQEYVNGDGDSVRVETYVLDADENAYGLFTFYRGGRPLDMGNEGDLASGGRLSFWQNRYFR